MKNTVRIYLPILLWLCFSNSIRAIEQPVDTTQVYSARYCVNTFKDQTVSSLQSVEGCDSLIVQNVTVSGTGDLKLSAPEGVPIYGLFEVAQGGVLNINRKESLVFEFTYDAAGNRTLREIGQ